MTRLCTRPACMSSPAVRRSDAAWSTGDASTGSITSNVCAAAAQRFVHRMRECVQLRLADAARHGPKRGRDAPSDRRAACAEPLRRVGRRGCAAQDDIGERCHDRARCRRAKRSKRWSAATADQARRRLDCIDPAHRARASDCAARRNRAHNAHDPAPTTADRCRSPAMTSAASTCGTSLHRAGRRPARRRAHRIARHRLPLMPAHCRIAAATLRSAAPNVGDVTLPVRIAALAVRLRPLRALRRQTISRVCQSCGSPSRSRPMARSGS